tara:strand:+ start:3539 stop:4117 length:579 start_codon:yes stop_codon:yes gene_type:complete
MDEVTLVLRLLSDRWSAAASALVSAGKITASHVETPRFIDVRSIKPNEGRRVDADQKAILIVYEDSNTTDYPTIDYAVRNETYTFTLHLRVLHRRDFADGYPITETGGDISDYEAGLVFSRDRLKALYEIARYILENNSLRPTVYVGGGTSGTVEGNADLIKLQSRSEANDRGKRLLGYKLAVEMKRFARTV